MLGAHSHYKRGFLPAAGPWLDQSATYLDAMGLIDSVIAHHEKVESEKHNG